MEILVNNIDKRDFKVRTNKGIIGEYNKTRKTIVKNKKDVQIGFAVIPFKYMDTKGNIQEANKCLGRVGFIPYGSNTPILPLSSWAATKINEEGLMTEWGYCIDNFDENEIKTRKQMIEKAKQLSVQGKPESYIKGWLKTYIDMGNKLFDEIDSNEELIELFRSKEKLPDPNDEFYEIGREIVVNNMVYVLTDKIDGRAWEPKVGQGGIIKKLEKSNIAKEAQRISKEVEWFGTNRDPKYKEVIRAYKGIVNEDVNRNKRGLNRIEATKQCVFPFLYKMKKNKEDEGVEKQTDKCVNTPMVIRGDFNKPGYPWCATEINDLGYATEWGYCTKEKVPEKDVELQKKFWNIICKNIQNEQWTDLSENIKDKLNEYDERGIEIGMRDIFNTIYDNCNRKIIAKYYKIVKNIIQNEFLKINKWSLKNVPSRNKANFRIKENLEQILFEKLKVLQDNYGLDLFNNIISDNLLWLIYYFYVIERVIVYSLLSTEGEVDREELERIKRIKKIELLNIEILKYESKIKKYLKNFISQIDKSGVEVDFNNGINNFNSDINNNIIIVNYEMFYGNKGISKDNRIIYYKQLNERDLKKIAPNIIFYNDALVEPKVEVIVPEIEEPIIYAEGEIIEEEKIPNKKETDWLEDDGELYSNYPEVNDPEFFLKLQRKEEFKINKMESWEGKKIEDLCRQDTFELSPAQQWVANYFNVETPYRGLLLWWGTGVGKTCASITIAEKHLDYYKKFNKRILVILGTSTLENYKKELYNFKKERLEIAKGLPPGTLQCTKDRYYMPIDSNNPTMLKKREQKILKRIEQDYEFITYGSLKGILTRLLAKRGIKLSIEGEEPKKKPKKAGEQVKVGDDIFEAVVNKKGILNWRKLIIEDKIREERTKLAISEYFSNRLIIIDEIQNIRTAGEGGDAIAPQMLEKIVHYSDDLKLVMMSATPMFNAASEIIYILNLLLENDGKDKVKTGDLFDSKGNLINPQKLDEICRGYISYVRGANPITFPLKKLPNESHIEFIRNNNQIYYPRPLSKMNGSDFQEDEYIRYNSLIRCDLSKYQENIFKRAILGEQDDEGNLGDATNETFDIKGKFICNITYPNKDLSNVDKSFGELGFDNCFTGEANVYNYTDNALIAGKPFLDYDLIERYSCKFKKILDNILNTDRGIIFIYSEYRKGGSLPLALMLEQNGFEQAVVEGKFGDLVVKNKLSSNLKRKKIQGDKPKWRYVLLDGDLEPKKRAQILEKCNSDENKTGSLIKVIIGTRVAGEGVDFARIRQVHILNPWDNLSRIDQVIGRGIRNCSHKDLPVEDRNVTVFLYSSHIKDNSTETTDEKIHRRAEKKDIQMKMVEVIMRNNSIDCMSNYLANKYLTDRDGGRECAYENCNEVFVCKDRERISGNVITDKDTFNIENHAIREIQKYKSFIKELFEKSAIYTIEQIRDYISSKMIIEVPAKNPKAPLGSMNVINNFNDDIFLVSLDMLITNKEMIFDKYKRIGSIVFKNGYYMFQPQDLSKTKVLPLYYRETPLEVKQENIEFIKSENVERSNELLKQWVKEVNKIIIETDDPDIIAYELDRVKLEVMKVLILEWFKGRYDPSLIRKPRLHRKLTQYFKQKGVFIMEEGVNQEDIEDDNDINPIAIYWNSNLSLEYIVDNQELKEHYDGEIFKPITKIYDFNGYPILTHVIGKLDIQEDKIDYLSYQHSVKFKLIDFNSFKKISDIHIQGMACASFGANNLRVLVQKITELDDQEIDEDILRRKPDMCRYLELTLRKYNRVGLENRIWWIEANQPYIFEK